MSVLNDIIKDPAIFFALFVNILGSKRAHENR